MSTPRTHDETKRDQRKVAKGDDNGAVTERQRIAKEQAQPGFLERMEEERQRPDFIERTRPEDPSDHFGQLTRDNVNPDIPSAEPGAGPIVQPESTSGGVPPPAALNQPEQWPQDQKVPSVSEYDKGEEGQQPKGKVAAPREGEPPPIQPLREGSINEPPGSDVYPGEGGPNTLPGDGSALPPGVELPPLVLTSLEPSSVVVSADPDFLLTVTGSGFTPGSVILFDDEELASTVVNQTTITARPAMEAAAAVVDVEVARGDDLSDVLTFEFTAVAGDARSRKEPERKAKKAEPASKRAKKDKPKAKR